MGWVLLKEVLSIEKGHKAIATTSYDVEYYSAQPVMVEMMAQLGGLLLGAEFDYGRNVVFAKIDQAVFLEVPEPNQSLVVEVYAESLGEQGGWMTGKVLCGKQVFSEARFMLAAMDEIEGSRKKVVTYDEGYLKHYGVREKIKEPLS